MIDTLCPVLRCTTRKEITKCTVYGHGEVMYGSCRARIKSDALSATTMRKLKYRKKTHSGCISCNGMSSFHTRNIWYNTSEGSIILWWRDKDFLLKIYWENHEPEVDGNVDQWISIPIKNRTQYIKIATPAITVYASILMRSVNTLRNL